jgi:hypothetical protein
MRKLPPENTGRVVAVAIAFFGTLAALAWIDGVFARLGRETLLALALFAAGFTVATYLLDRQVRGLVDRWAARAFRSGRAKSPAAKRAAT